ncbi:MAG: hypothetical protein JNL72_14795 [Flavipsychrobacter sp.]|nr:hypothetical protein [Flavipsychrobacter sp.]
MKRIITIVLISLAATKAMAQYGTGAGASQSASMALSDVIEIIFTETGSVEGSTVFMPFTSSQDFKNGVTVRDQELRVRANTAFKVSLKYDMNTFTYVGNEKVSPDLLKDALGVKVTQNNTGGQVAAPFSQADYAPIATADRDLVVNGESGGNQRFAVKYKCAPKKALPVGSYFVNVVYTATKN